MKYKVISLKYNMTLNVTEYFNFRVTFALLCLYYNNCTVILLKTIFHIYIFQSFFNNSMK